jgi:hypothetical protein
MSLVISFDVNEVLWKLGMSLVINVDVNVEYGILSNILNYMYISGQTTQNITSLFTSEKESE